MHDEWQDRLSEYLDGELSVAEQAALEEHLVVCDVCRVTLGELRAIIVAARAVENPPPERDLWLAIAAAIDARAGVVPLRPAPARRRISFTVPQLAAAALLLMAGSGAAVWFLAGAAGTSATTVSGAIVHAAAEPAPGARLIAATPPDPEYDATVAQLEQTLRQRRGQLDPATVEVLERSMETIDQAMADARAALAADPANPYLRRQLESTMQRKLDVLRRANGIRRAGA